MGTRTIEFPIVEEYVTLADDIMSGRQDVALYGFGRIGKWVFDELHSRGVEICAILDGNSVLWGQSHIGVPICSPDDCNRRDCCVIICSNLYIEEMLDQLEYIGVHTHIPYSFIYSGRRFPEDEYYNNLMDMQYMNSVWTQKRKKNDDFLVLRNLDVVISEKCSLRCRDCANLMQYFVSPVHSDFDQTIGALDRLLHTVDYVHEVHVLGGEPFLNPELAEYLAHMQEFRDRFDFIIIFTNGTILPNPGLITRLKQPNIFVSITDYGHPNQKVAKCVEMFEQSGVHYRRIAATKWQDCGWVYAHHRAESENIEILQRCCVRNLPSIKNGALFRCPFAGNAASLSAVPEKDNPFVELSNAHIPWAEMRTAIRELLHSPFFPACDYCGGRSLGELSIPAAVQAEKPLHYKKYQE